MKNRNTFYFFIIFLAFNSQIVCQTNIPKWAYDATIYEVNIRQFTIEGTFKAFEEHLPRLHELGVDILWLMPVHPIGELNRKGTLGSYYSVKDYKGINPEFGTPDDFKSLINKIHSLNMYVIIDWVANHTSWDNTWVEEFPEFYTRDEKGNFVPPVEDWSDVIDLNFDNKELWTEMAGALKFWVEEYDLDGFRCDFAGMVPVEFWNFVRPQLDKIKDVFMLAEWDTPELHENAFDMTYDWQMHKIMNNIYGGTNTVSDLINHIEQDRSRYPGYAFRMQFTDNHDENTWNGTVFERLGNAAETFAALTYTIPGMPLIYSGQETGNNKRLEFFEKDPIEWNIHSFEELYKSLNKLRKDNPALWSGIKGGDFQIVPNTTPGEVFTFLRSIGDNTLFMVFNLSDQPVETELKNNLADGDYREFFTQKFAEVIAMAKSIKLQPWEYRVYIKL
ncbi:MAG: alpha-amylase family glycosyl hydrolase [Ignavibacteriaceae bacterium]